MLSALIAQGASLTITGEGSTGSVIAGEGFTLSSIISTAIAAVLAIAGIIFFFMLIIGGVQWILSGGDKTNTENARNRITSALIGLVIVFAAFAIIQLLDAVFGVSILDVDIPQIGGGAAGGGGS